MTDSGEALPVSSPRQVPLVKFSMQYCRQMSGFLTKLEAGILWSHHEEIRELPGESDNARNNATCTQARKATHGLNRQHQDVDRTPRGRVNQNDRGQR